MLKKSILFIIISIVIVFAIVRLPSYLRPERQDRLIVSGRVEADETRLSTEISGRLKEVYIRDGMGVKKGDIIALIDDEELQSKKRELVHSINELKERVASQEINLDYLKKDIVHRIDEADNALSITRARLRQAEASKLRAEAEYRRYSSLLSKGVIAKDKFESVELAYKISLEELNTATEGVKTAEISLKRAKDSRSIIDARQRDVNSLKRSLDAMKERLRQIDINIGYTEVRSPSDGVILRKVAEAGEIMPRGGVIGILIDPEDIYVKTFVPESYIGMVRLNMEVEVISDAYRDRPVQGYICYIADQAEFTPKEVQSYEERVKQVFAVKICFRKDERGGYEILKKGMPVDVRFPVSGETS